MVLKIFKLAWLAVLSTLLLPSCMKSDQINSEKLLYWSSNNPDEIRFAKYIVNAWNTENPGKKITFQPVPEGRSSEEVILAAVVGKTTPDIYSNMWQGDVEFFARSGVLIPLDTLKGFLPALRSRCDSAVISEITSTDGHIYQIPWKINPIMLIYNIRMFEKIGWKEAPATYSEFLQAAKMIQKDTDNDGYVDRWIGYSEILATWWQRFFDFYPLYLAASSGGKLVENNRVVFNNRYAVEVFNFLKTIYDNNYFSRELLSARQDVFLTGIIATRFTGPWEIVHAEKFKTADFKYGFSPMPVPDDFKDHTYTYGDPKNIVIFNTCRYPQRAWEFLEYIVNEQNDIKFLEMTTQLPRRKDLLQNPLFVSYFENHPKMLPFATQAKYVRGTDICAQLKEIFDVISQEYEACVVYGVKSPEQAVSDAAKAAQVLLD